MGSRHPQIVTMDAIRKKMQSLKAETDTLYKTIAGFEEATAEAVARADKADCDIRDYGKKVQQLEIGFDETNDKLTKANEALEEAEKQFKELESESPPSPGGSCSWRRRTRSLLRLFAPQSPSWPCPPRPPTTSSRRSRLLREPASTTRSPLRSWTRTREPPSRWPPTMNRSWTNCPGNLEFRRLSSRGPWTGLSWQRRT